MAYYESDEYFEDGQKLRPGALRDIGDELAFEFEGKIDALIDERKELEESPTTNAEWMSHGIWKRIDRLATRIKREWQPEYGDINDIEGYTEFKRIL